MLTPLATPAALEKYWTLPDFALTERSGRTVHLADLAGKVWVADFIYTTCPGPCPVLSGHLSDLQKAVGADDRVRFVSITVDPENDTPEVLKTYAERFHAGERWLFLTGKKDDIAALARDGFKLPVADATAAGAPIAHSTRFILVDKTGAVRGLRDGVDGRADELVRDIRALLDEK
jgi:protein SCO1/2